MKLKFTTKPAEPNPTPNEPTPAPPTPGGGFKLNLKVGGGTDVKPTQDGPAEPKQKRKYTKKPKPEDGDNGGSAAGKKRKAKDTGNGDGAVKRVNDGSKGTGSVKIRLSSMSGGQTAPATTASLPKITIPARILQKSRSASTPHIRIKAKGQPPPRPLGAGYDSEGEDIEIDPAIESQLILRMRPGDDCTYLRKAIQERRVGLKLSEGGADVAMKFFDKQGRRAVITIRGRQYAAALFDLPCIIEGMKSWDRKGWYKSADICQILVVLQQCESEEAAKNLPLPRDMERWNWQYPHGLTPPMHYVRKRRFRKRLSHRTIEHVEEEVEKLLRDDDLALTSRGSTAYELVDQDGEPDDEEDAEGEMEVDDDYGQVIPGYEQTEEPQEAEDDEFDNAFALGFADTRAIVEDGMSESPATAVADSQTLPTTAVGDGSNLAAPLITSASQPSPAETEGTGTGAEADAEEDDGLFSGDDEDDEDEVDEEELARQQERKQLEEEVADLKKEIEIAEKAAQKQSNPLLKQRALQKIRSLKEDLRLKRASLGEEAE